MEPNCKRTCDGKCEVLENLMTEEKEALNRFKAFMEMCDYPDVQTFLTELFDARRALHDRIVTKIETLRVQSLTTHQIRDSFESSSW